MQPKKFNLLIGKTNYMHYQESMKEQTPILKMIKMINIFHHHCFPPICKSVAIFTNPQFFCCSKWKGQNNFEETRIDAHERRKENSILCSFVRISYCLHCKYSHHLKKILLSKMHDNIQHVEKVDSKNLILPHKKFQQQTTNHEKDIKKVMIYLKI
jgi:hypothetical protein